MSTFASATRALAVPALLTALTFGLPTAVRAQTSSTVTPAQSAAPAAPASAPAAKAKARTRHHATTRPGIEQRIATLHTQLRITASQEAQWGQIADVMRQNAAAVEAAIKDRQATASTMSAMENLQSYQKIAQAHAQGMEKLIPAFQTLYDSMTDAQKKNADSVFRATAARHEHRTPAKKKAG